LLDVTRLGEVTCIRLSREMSGRPVYWTAAYLIDGLLIDTGCAHTAAELAGFLEEEHAAGRPVSKVVITHHHEDHIGANRLLEEHWGLKALAPSPAIPLIRDLPDLEPYRRFVWGRPGPSDPQPLGEVVETAGHRFRVVPVPGHCRDHVAFVDEARGWCFSGDLFVAERFKVLRSDEDVGEMVRSMETLARLPTGTGRLVLFTGIGRVFEDGRRSLERCVRYLRDLARRARSLRDEGLSVPAIRDTLFGRESTFAALTGGHYSSENLVRGLLEAELD